MGGEPVSTPFITPVGTAEIPRGTLTVNVLSSVDAMPEFLSKALKLKDRQRLRYFKCLAE